MSESEVFPIAIRPIAVEDLPFVTDSWLRSTRHSHIFTDLKAFERTQRKVIAQLVQSSKAAIACSLEDPDQIFGYAIWEETRRKPVLHWAFVKSDFRRLGIFTRLMALVDPKQKGVVLTHKSEFSQRLRDAGMNIVLDEYALLVRMLDDGGAK